MILKAIFKSLMIVFMCMVGAFGYWAWQAAIFDNRVPVTITRAEVLNSPIFAGQSLTLRTWREKVRGDCLLHSIRTAVDADGALVLLPDYVGPGGPVNTAFSEVDYQTVAGMHPGNWFLRIHLTFICPGITFEIDHPTMPFRIEARP